LTEEEDSSKLREAFKYLLEINNRDIITVIAENLDTSIINYCNEHAVRVAAPLLRCPPKD
jgi:hypothetical protein